MSELVIKIKGIKQKKEKKQKTNKFGLVFIMINLALILTGCANSNPPQTNISEAQIYQMAMNQSNSGTLHAVRAKVRQTPIFIGQTKSDKNNVFVNLDTKIKQAQNQLNHTFPRLPNPETVVYVYPHLGPDGVPVPGYYTVFQLYTKDHYALPGEISVSKQLQCKGAL